MKFPIFLQPLPVLALSIASLGGCTPDAEPVPNAHVDASASASQGWPSYIEEINESVRSMSGEIETGA